MAVCQTYFYHLKLRCSEYILIVLLQLVLVDFDLFDLPIFSVILNWGTVGTTSDLLFSFYFARMADLFSASFYRQSAFLQGCWIQ